MANNNLSKFKKAIAQEKVAATEKKYTIDQSGEDKFNKADKFLNVDLQQQKEKIKLRKKSFLVPENEYSTITSTIKILIAEGIIAKPTDVFRIALSALRDLTKNDVVNIFKKLDKISPGKPKSR